MNLVGRFLVFLLSLVGAGPSRRLAKPTTWRPSFPVHADYVQGQLSAGTLYRLLRDRDAAVPA